MKDERVMSSDLDQIAVAYLSCHSDIAITREQTIRHRRHSVLLFDLVIATLCSRDVDVRRFGSSSIACPKTLWGKEYKWIR